MELKDKFWKFASTNKTGTLEKIFIEWAGKEKISINDFNSVYAQVSDEVDKMFDKKALRVLPDGTFEGTPQEIQEFTKNQNPEEQPITDLNSTPTDAPMEESPIEEPMNEPMEEPLAEEPINPEPEINNEQPLDNKSAISPEPNSAISEDNINGEEKTFPFFDIIGS
jgi:hypothetical protein